MQNIILYLNVKICKMCKGLKKKDSKALKFEHINYTLYLFSHVAYGCLTEFALNMITI